MGSFPIYHRDDYWKIYYEMFRDGKKLAQGLHWKSYKHKSSASRAARQTYALPRVYPETGEVITYRWIVSQTNPWTE